MALIVEFICELPNGVHARPASHVETLCNTFSSQIEWHNLRTDRKGNAKSALALIGTDTLAGDLGGVSGQAGLKEDLPLLDPPQGDVAVPNINGQKHVSPSIPAPDRDRSFLAPLYRNGPRIATRG